MTDNGLGRTRSRVGLVLAADSVAQLLAGKVSLIGKVWSWWHAFADEQDVYIQGGLNR
jgi:hypothetical protein